MSNPPTGKWPAERFAWVIGDRVLLRLDFYPYDTFASDMDKALAEGTSNRPPDTARRFEAPQEVTRNSYFSEWLVSRDDVAFLLEEHIGALARAPLCLPEAPDGKVSARVLDELVVISWSDQEDLIREIRYVGYSYC